MQIAFEPNDSLVYSALELVEATALVVEREGKIVFYNEAARSIVGVVAGRNGSRSPDAGHHDLAACSRHCGFQSPDGRNAIASAELPWNRAIRGEPVANSEFFVRNRRNPDGIYVRANWKPEVDSAGSVVRALVTLQDISSQRRAEQDARAARALTRILVEENQAGVLRTTVAGRIVACNSAFAHMLGYANPQEVALLSADQLHMPGAHRAMMACLHSEQSVRGRELLLRRKDGSRCEVLANVQVLDPDSEESEASILTTLVNVSDYRGVERARRNSEERFAEFARYVPGLLFIKDSGGRFVFLSGASLPTIGVDPAVALGKTDFDFFSSERAEIYRKSDLEVMTTKRPARLSVDIDVKENLHHWTVLKFPIPDETGELTHVGGVAVDDTDRVTLEAQLQEAERMDAAGRLAGSMAHDFNNLLTVISGYGQMLSEAIERRQPPAKLTLYLDEMMNASTRAAKLTDQLLAFGRKQPVKVRRLDMRELVSGMASKLRSALGEQIELLINTAAEPCWVRVDSTQMERVITNIAMNARDAMPNGGRFMISTAPAIEHQPPGMKAETYVHLRIADSGVGISANPPSRVFEPFFSTKPKGHAIGLGLSTAHGIVKQSGGDITVQSMPGQGTTFDIYLPPDQGLSGVPAIHRVARGPLPKAFRGTETVLVVEDDYTVRLLVKAMLERYGYRPILAEGPEEALALYDRHAPEIDIVLTDVIMPVMSGRILALTLRRECPTLKVLYMSGYTDEEIANQGVLGAGSLVRKPFNSETLIGHLRAVLDAPLSTN